jgi:hypothetical protein
MEQLLSTCVLQLQVYRRIPMCLAAHHHCMHVHAQPSKPVLVILRQGWSYYRQALTIYQYGPHPLLGDGILYHQFSMNGGHMWSIFLCSFYYVGALHRVLSSVIQYAWDTRKKSGIWHLAENLQNNCDSRNWDSTLPITPDHSRLGIIGNYWE